MKNEPVVFSIIIAFKSWSYNLEECLKCIRKLTFKEFELILLPDYEMTLAEEFRDLPIVNACGAAVCNLGTRGTSGT